MKAISELRNAKPELEKSPTGQEYPITSKTKCRNVPNAPPTEAATRRNPCYHMRYMYQNALGKRLAPTSVNTREITTSLWLTTTRSNRDQPSPRQDSRDYSHTHEVHICTSRNPGRIDFQQHAIQQQRVQRFRPKLGNQAHHIQPNTTASVRKKYRP